MKRGLLRQITELQTLSHADLKEHWRELIGSEPPSYSRAVLIKRLAYRLQELVYGGISDVVRAELRERLGAERLDTDGQQVTRLERRKRKDGMPVPGTRLVREWRGQRYEVTVVPGGFEYGGRRYRSLSAIANLITGTRWNGPAFFGLRRPQKELDS